MKSTEKNIQTVAVVFRDWIEEDLKLYVAIEFYKQDHPNTTASGLLREALREYFEKRNYLAPLNRNGRVAPVEETQAAPEVQDEKP